MTTQRKPRLTHLFITTHDLAAMREFYVNLLGLDMLVDEGDYLRVGGGGGAHMGMEPAAKGALPAVELNIEVGDVDAVVERLSIRGVQFDALPADMPWGARHAWLRDPAGHRLSLYSRSE